MRLYYCVEALAAAIMSAPPWAWTKGSGTGCTAGSASGAAIWSCNGASLPAPTSVPATCRPPL